MISRDDADDFMISLAPVAHRSGLREQDRAVKAALLSYTAFKERLNASQGSRRDPWFLALLLNHARIAENLDGCRITTIGGRPPLAKAAIRMLYEGFTNILLIGFHSGEITERDLNRNLKLDGPVTREYMAERFLGFGDFARWQQLSYLVRSADLQGRELISDKSLLLPGVDPQQRIQEFQRVAEDAVSKFGFGERTLNWHPFKNAHAIKRHLWPEGGNALFPAQEFHISRHLWDDLYFLAYKAASHEVHGSPSALMSAMGPREAYPGLVHDTPYYDPLTLTNALGVFTYASAAFADALGLMADWNASFS